MSDTEVDSVNTVYPLLFQDTIENIKNAAKECSESNDFISFSTILDVYLSDWNSYDVDERFELMDLLYTILDENKKLLYEIAWDLPPLLLPFLDCEWPIRFSLKDSKQVGKFFKVFNLLAQYGGPKELFLTCCEILSDLKDSENTEPLKQEDIVEVESKLDEEYKINFDDIDLRIYTHLQNKPVSIRVLKFHALFQCISFSFKRIETIYPSKFLAIIVSSVLNFVSNSPEVCTTVSVLRTLYLFLRDYKSPLLPIDDGSNSKEDLAKVANDETYLQTKLKRLIYDTIIERICVGPGSRSLIGKLVPAISEHNLNDSEYVFELVDRLIKLSNSLDINISKSFSIEIKQSSLLFDKNIHLINKSEDIITLVVSSYNNSSFRDKQFTSLPASPVCVSFLYVYGKYIENLPFKIDDDITVFDLIKFQLKIFIPYIIDPKLSNMTVVSYLLVLTIVKIESIKQILNIDDFKNDKNILLILTYLQNISVIILNSDSKYSKKILSNFMKKFLQYLPDEFSYKYIMDTLQNCPFDEYIPIILKTFRYLISTNKYDDDELVKNFNNMNIGNENAKESKRPPKLPNRSETISVNKFINFSTERQSDFIKLVETTITEISDELNKNVLNTSQYHKLLGLINFANSTELKDADTIQPVFDKFDELSGKLNDPKLTLKSKNVDKPEK